MATTKACPNSLRGSSADRLSTENPPAVVSAAPHIALPVVAEAFSTQTCCPPDGLCSTSSSNLVVK